MYTSLYIYRARQLFDNKMLALLLLQCSQIADAACVGVPVSVCANDHSRCRMQFMLRFISFIVRAVVSSIVARSCRGPDRL